MRDTPELVSRGVNFYAPAKQQTSGARQDMGGVQAQDGDTHQRFSATGADAPAHTGVTGGGIAYTACDF